MIDLEELAIYRKRHTRPARYHGDDLGRLNYLEILELIDTAEALYKRLDLLPPPKD